MDNSERIRIIDLQHHELFDIFADIQSRREPVDRLYAESAMDKLTEYVHKHLTFEERFMANIDFPDLESHAHEHEGIRRRIADTREKLNTADPAEWTGVVSQLAAYLEHWLKEHILSIDMKYRKFMG
ncbi:MAG: hemerythrin family protein [Magnetococcales bacterium]|nr:hemerythrin family protein [Magnetococcales bacterium]